MRIRSWTSILERSPSTSPAGRASPVFYNEAMTSNEIRASFLDYFKRNGHRVVPSSSLVPGDDPTLLFTNAGMNQFKDVFLGREKRDYTRATTAQKVMRVSGKHNDLDNVGPSLRHHTFFEMLGNFSFGDYFKKEALPFAWQLLTDVWKLPEDRMVVSIFKGEAGIPRDDEAYEVWRSLGVPSNRIVEYGAEDNFWQMGDTGPCGRCSEIYFVRDAGGDPEIEIWNNVFMEFERSADGTLTPLPAKSIDTGMGFERITSVLQNKLSNYDTDLFTPLLDEIGRLIGRRHGGSVSDPHDISMRVVADHMRSTTFLIADGVIPSNEWRGYVLRKIMRRAMRHGKHLGFTEPFMHRLVSVLDREMGDAYPEVRRNREMIEKTILAEENRFDAVLREGLPRLEAELAKALETPDHVLKGDAAFRLYDTFGVPFDFIEDTAETQHVKVDLEGYNRAMEDQRGKARAGSAFGGGKKVAGLRASGRRLGTQGRRRSVRRLHDDERGPRGGRGGVRRRTSRGGCARGGPGWIRGAGEDALLPRGRRAGVRHRAAGCGNRRRCRGRGRCRPHRDRAASSAPREGVLRAPAGWRHAACRSGRGSSKRDATKPHGNASRARGPSSGARLAREAGGIARRARSAAVRLRPLPGGDARRDPRIEKIVNEQIYRNTPVTTDVRSTDEAIAAGAMALFGEKYGDRVRVVSIPGFSMELCGGTHVAATGDIGFFVIVAEGGVAAGVRRIEALTGAGAVEWVQRQRAALSSILETLEVPAEQATDAIEKLQTESKRLAREVTQLKTRVAMGGGGAASDDTVLVNGVTLARRKVEDFDKDALRGLADSLKARIKTGVVVLASANDGKVQIIVAVTPDLTSRVKAGTIVKEIAPIVGGGGGGRPDFAEAGGKLPEKIDEMLTRERSACSRSC